MLDLPPRPPFEIEPGAHVLPGFASTAAEALLAAVAAVADEAPFRTYRTRGGPMSVAMTAAGPLGWVSDKGGYRYAATDPVSGRPWPAMPAVFATLASEAADAAGFAGFVPDSCLVNRYAAGARMGLHQDRDERDQDAPIVSVSLGLSAVFLWGGARRGGATRRTALGHGDVVVWGGPARLAYHGVAPLADGLHPATGAVRYNLTLRRAG